MKFIVACLSLIIIVTSPSAFADETIQRNFGVSVKNINGLTVRKSLSETSMLYAGISLGKGQQSSTFNDSFVSSDSTTNFTVYSGFAGFRKYLNNDRLSKFINLEVGRSFSKSDNTYNSSISVGSSDDAKSQSTAANITYGFEYFISSNISIEGAAGIGMSWGEGTTSYGSYAAYKAISLPLASIALTYYW